MTSIHATSRVTSADGTTLAVDTAGGGSGTPVVLIGGAFNDRGTVAALAGQLAGSLPVVTYDRRGRGGSDDKSTGFEVRNEIDDLAAVIGHAGGRAFLFGHSSGAIVVLEAAMRGLPVAGLAVYEPPFRADPELPFPGPETLADLKDLVAAGDDDGAAEYFLRRCLGVPEQGVIGMRHGKGWESLVRNASTLPYDVLVSAPWELVDRERLAGIGVPVLAMYGDRTAPNLAAGTRAVSESVAGAELVVVPGEDHGVLQRPAAIAPRLIEFYQGLEAGEGV